MVCLVKCYLGNAFEVSLCGCVSGGYGRGGGGIDGEIIILRRGRKGR
ncbi:MAG: hypothetical protein ISS45_07620 [Candidatus Omnitrophica bacterium]|nr:hypothetical protein [Candidatus Omnitrophota bacterium]